MMHGPEKSDSAIRAKKSANKAASAAAGRFSSSLNRATSMARYDEERWTVRSCASSASVATF